MLIPENADSRLPLMLLYWQILIRNRKLGDRRRHYRKTAVFGDVFRGGGGAAFGVAKRSAHSSRCLGFGVALTLHRDITASNGLV